MTLQGIFEYPGIQRFKSARYTQGYGILPDVITVDIIPQPASTISRFGTARFAFGNLEVRLPNCAVDFATIRRTNEGYVERLRIFDSRWHWQFGEITARYNERDSEDEIRAELEKSPQQMASELFIAMGVSSFDVSQLPNDSRPYVNWECANPAEELQKLCDLLGCRIILGHSGAPAKVGRIGIGLPLPDDSDVVSVSYGVDPPEYPDSIAVCTARSLFQSKLRLEAVGRDTDGKIKKIGDLSYKPDAGWGDYKNFTDISEEAMQLAKDTVFRLYRVKTQADGTFDVPGYDGVVSSIDQILPIRSQMIETFEDVDGLKRPKYAEVRGIFRPYRDPESTDNTPFDTKCDVGFRVLGTEGYVYFEHPVFQVDDNDELQEAELYLETSYHVRDFDSDQPVRYGVSRDLRVPPIGTGPKVINYSDIGVKCYGTYSVLRDTYKLESATCNKIDVETECHRIIDTAVDEYSINESYSVAYRGLKTLQLDGAIRQVTWVVQDRYPGCATYASLNSETDPYVLPYVSRRRYIRERVLEKSVTDREALEDYSR